IPATVKVEYLDEETNESLYVGEDGKEYETKTGYVNDEYRTTPRDIPYYAVVEEKLPRNANGIFGEDEVTVTYYYRKLNFNMKVEKEFVNVVVNNEVIDSFDDKKNIEATIKYKDINTVGIKAIYKITVTNTEEVAGTAVVEENIPEGFEFVASESDGKWELVDGKYTLTTEELLPGESKEYVVVLSWVASEKNYGSKKNIALIIATENGAEYAETLEEDNKDEAIIKIVLSKDETIEKETEAEVKGIEKKKPTPGIRRNGTKSTKTGDDTVYYLASIAIAGIVMVIAIKKKDN
ncbi:MAG: MucBP domain-containing protein, partial [Clostridia bacterium]|nr:MucBP domain-containing protein [Clostridia bacterium]